MSDLYLEHHGILGQKWGVRRFQNEDGSLTSAGQKRYVKNLKKDYNSTNHATFDHKKYQKRQQNEIKSAISEKELQNLKIKADAYNKTTSPNRYGIMTDREYKAWDNYEKDLDKVVNKIVGEYGNKTLSWALNNNARDEVKRLIDNMVMSEIYNK